MNDMGKGKLASTDENRMTEKPDPVHPRKPRPRDGDSQLRIGDALRSVYRQAVDEPIPADFIDLLDKLR